ncbi:MAG TPA: ferrous iron transport protein A [Deltaproteobacteria bacterium]|nr:MAG: hypothetical protein DRG83_02925 [Deltaproteobacteria bacterium]RLB09294.1 MAG: hypothetical protein DRG59_02750 [Deltaproteobacteria bacterium]HDM75918.1 ferrous iron transport protein A [Deltaproteobacteria bacterium]HEC31933.1 ferrous iron transport protein A [Deltaproteobacteria bacterium]
MANALKKAKESSILSVRRAPCGAFPLTLADCGQRLRIVRLLGGRTFQCRMASIGLCPGQRIEVSTNNGKTQGPRIVTTDAGRFALGCGMCQKILVAPWDNQDTTKSTTKPKS